MYYTRAFNNSLFISITFHACLGLFFFFIMFPHPLPIFKIIEISIVKLPEKEEIKVVEYKPKIIKRRVIGAVKKEPELKLKKTPKSIEKPIVWTPVKPNVVQKVAEVITPVTIPPAPGGLEKNEFHGEIPIPKAVTNEEISQSEEGKGSRVISTPPSNEEIKDGEEESIGPYIYISGPASKRKALYQPKFEIPLWLEQKGQSIHGKLGIWVLPDGSVDKVEIEESFGYAEIDRLAQSTVYKWRFYKLPPNVKTTDRGIVTIAIQLR